MIRLTRVRTVPPVHRNFFGEKRKAINLDLLQKKLAGKLDQGGDKKWNSTIWKEAKDQLLAETHQKCAYCETPTRVVAYGDVEHFRPKSVYWWLAYCYENYLASCTVCNQEYKKDNFILADPVNRLNEPSVTTAMTKEELERLASTMTPDPANDEEGMPFAAFEKELLEESALLIHPYHQDPAEYFAYEPLLASSEVFIVPARTEYAGMVKAAEDFYGINRQELLDLRFQVYMQYMTFRHTLHHPDLPDYLKVTCKNRLEEMRADTAAYAGMIRYFDTKELPELPWDFHIKTAGV